MPPREPHQILPPAVSQFWSEGTPPVSSTAKKAQSPKEHKQVKCCNCGDNVDEDDALEHDGGMYCDDCHNEVFACCDECGDVYVSEDGLCLGDSNFCSERCAHGAGWHECNDCSEWDNDCREDANSHVICSSCQSDYYDCDDCGDMFHCDDLQGGYCRDCRTSNGYSRFIKEYSWQPSEFLFQKMPWENTMYLGIELEIECGDEDRHEAAEAVTKWLERRKLNERVYLKEDGSLDNGFEIVFMPSTLAALNKKFPMKEFLAYLRKLKLTSHETGSCGLHVHISRDNLTSEHLWAGKMFFFLCQEQLLKFSRRSDTEFCRFDTSLPQDGRRQDFGRYSAFNTSATTNTVEVRIFRGTLNYGSFAASLEFCDLFGEYIQKANVASLRLTNGKDLWSEFLAFGKTSKKYGEFLRYCETKGVA